MYLHAHEWEAFILLYQNRVIWYVFIVDLKLSKEYK